MRETMFGLATWLAQIEAESGAPPDAGGGQPGNQMNLWSCLLPAVAGLVLMYLMMATKPRGADAQKGRELLANLKKNDKVITAGGIYGIVVQTSADSEYVTVRIDESNNTRIKLLKSSIARVIADEGAEKEKEA
jgi:preprotein translocase subunit YajC